MKCDRNRYKQILLNLLGNAIKFTESGSVTIHVEYDQITHLLWTCVLDTGVGIKEEDKGKLFAFFGKLDGQQALNPQGAGLGLYICKKLTEAMKGSIKLESEHLKGTTISFSIQDLTFDPSELLFKEDRSPTFGLMKENYEEQIEENISGHPITLYKKGYKRCQSITKELLDKISPRIFKA